jgi:hypothetical protein
VSPASPLRHDADERLHAGEPPALCPVCTFPVSMPIHDECAGEPSAVLFAASDFGEVECG